jgi:signal transduction histidine kinase
MTLLRRIAQSLRHRLTGLLAGLAALALPPGTAAAQDQVVLQLRWDHQFQFAGYYAAQWQGYYDEAGLEVEIRSAIDETGRVRNAPAEVEAGRADFGIGAADILVANNRGANLWILASVFQQSGIGFVTLAENRIDSLAEIPDLRVARLPNDLIDVEFQAMLRSEGIDPSLVTAYPTDNQFDTLFNGEVDMAQSYLLSSLWFARQREVELAVLRASSYGVDFYGDSLFAHERLVQGDRDLVDRFLQASLRGWEYALTHHREIAQRIARELPRQVPVPGDPIEFNLFQSTIVRDLTLYPLVEVGHASLARWERIHRHLASVGVVDQPADLSETVYDPLRMDRLEARRLQLSMGVGLAVAAILFLAGTAWIVSLRKAVETRTRELELARDRAELANRTKSEFLSNVSHELRTPLNVIIGFAEIIKDQLMGPSNVPRYSEYAEDIYRSGNHLLDLVNDLLDLARIESGRLGLKLENVEMAELVDNSMDMVRYNANAAGIVLDRKVDRVLPEAWADRRAVKQILINLLSNAIKFTPKGGRVSVEVERVGSDRLRLSVRDTGVGIAPANLDRLRNPNGRASDRFTAARESGGLGLSIARLLAEAHGGSLQIDSRLGVGTSVEVTLPAREAA